MQKRLLIYSTELILVQELRLSQFRAKSSATTTFTLPERTSEAGSLSTNSLVPGIMGTPEGGVN